jgi:ACS family pantothenate transporter-like MFS transporter
MTEAKAMSPVASSPDLNKGMKDASSISIAGPSCEEKGKTSFWRKTVGLVWDSVEGDPEYRRYVQRLDTFFLYGLSVFDTH